MYTLFSLCLLVALLSNWTTMVNHPWPCHRRQKKHDELWNTKDASKFLTRGGVHVLVVCSCRGSERASIAQNSGASTLLWIMNLKKIGITNLKKRLIVFFFNSFFKPSIVFLKTRLIVFFFNRVFKPSIVFLKKRLIVFSFNRFFKPSIKIWI